MSDDERTIHFVDAPAAGDAVLAQFTEPEVRYAVVSVQRADGSGHAALHVRMAAAADAPQADLEWLHAADGTPFAMPVLVKLRGAQVLWRPGRAVIGCDAEQGESLLGALVEFAHYEQELRRLEAEIAAAWPDLYEDKALAFDVTPEDLRRSDVVGERMSRTLLRRIRLARLEAHLGRPALSSSEAGRKLGEDLRDKANVEGRAEVLDGQIEVFEGIYEMSSQRMGEYRASRQGHIMEWIIIVLLAAETLVMLSQVVWRTHG